jgi:hypothetical protein
VREALEEQGFPLPETMPAITALHVDPEGFLWARRFAPPGTTDERWAVFGPDAFIGHVVLPAGFALTDIGTDWVLGVETSELGSQRIVLYSLLRS